MVGCDCAAMLCTCDMAAMMPAFGSPPETAVKCVRVFQCVYRSPQFHPLREPARHHRAGGRAYLFTLAPPGHARCFLHTGTKIRRGEPTTIV